MKNKFFLIGGIENNYSLLKDIIQYDNNTNKNFLYIGFGNNYSESIYNKLKREFQDLGYQTKQIKRKSLAHDINIAKERIKEASIIYIGGGDTIELKRTIEEYHLENDLKDVNKDVLLVGESAGAILLSKEGFSDSKILRKESTKHEFIKGLKLVDICISPHYDKDSQKTKELIEIIKNTKTEVYGIPNNCIMIIENNKIKKIEKNEKEKITIIKG